MAICYALRRGVLVHRGCKIDNIKHKIIPIELDVTFTVQGKFKHGVFAPDMRVERDDDSYTVIFADDTQSCSVFSRSGNVINIYRIGDELFVDEPRELDKHMIRIMRCVRLYSQSNAPEHLEQALLSLERIVTSKETYGYIRKDTCELVRAMYNEVDARGELNTALFTQAAKVFGKCT